MDKQNKNRKVFPYGTLQWIYHWKYSYNPRRVDASYATGSKTLPNTYAAW